MPSRFSVQVEPDALRFDAPADQTLLLSAEQAGIAWPSSCRNGTCRTCHARVLQGRVSYRIDWPGLLPEEKAQGWILPCVAYPESPLVVERPLPFAPTVA